MSGRIKYGTTIFEHIEVPNHVFDGGTKATNISGLASNGATAYCVKRGGDSSKEQSALYTIEGFNSSSPRIASETVIPCNTFGMTYYNGFLYIAATGGKILKVSTSGTVSGTYTHSINAQGIAHYEGDKFILMANSLNSSDKSVLCFVTGTFSNAVFNEVDRFYIKNTALESFGDLILQDIYYDDMYGLFIVTNEKVNGAYNGNNIIMRADIKKEMNTVGNYGGIEIKPIAEYKFVGKAAKYKQCNVESMIIGPDRKIYTVANIVRASSSSTGFTKDGMFYIGNLRFNDDAPFWCKIYFNNGVSIPSSTATINGQSATFSNPGAFTLNGKIGYAIVSCTNHEDENIKDNAAFLLKTTDINSKAFTKVNDKIIRGLGHGNGLAYYNDALYVAAYNKNPGYKKKNIVKLSLEGKTLATYTCNHMVGGIAHYSGNQFLGLNYEAYDKYRYSEKPKFFIGTFNDTTKEFVISKTFITDNPGYAGGVLQDIHYDAKYGLFFISRDNGIDHIYRISVEDIANASDGQHVDVAEQWLCDDKVHEVEGFCISNGKMYAAINEGNNDRVCLVQTFDFY